MFEIEEIRNESLTLLLSDSQVQVGSSHRIEVGINHPLTNASLRLIQSDTTLLPIGHIPISDLQPRVVLMSTPITFNANLTLSRNVAADHEVVCGQQSQTTNNLPSWSFHTACVFPCNYDLSWDPMEFSKGTELSC